MDHRIDCNSHDVKLIVLATVVSLSASFSNDTHEMVLLIEQVWFLTTPKSFISDLWQLLFYKRTEKVSVFVH